MDLDKKYAWVFFGLAVACVLSAVAYTMWNNRPRPTEAPPAPIQVVQQQPLPQPVRPATPKPVVPREPNKVYLQSPVQVPVPVIPTWYNRWYWDPRWDTYRWDNRWDDRHHKRFPYTPWEHREPSKDKIDKHLDNLFRTGKRA